jgi:hypothetical protein
MAPPNKTITTQRIKTTHPCQATGNPHPQPYRFAANQIGREPSDDVLSGNMMNVDF